VGWYFAHLLGHPQPVALFLPPWILRPQSNPQDQTKWADVDSFRGSNCQARTPQEQPSTHIPGRTLKSLLGAGLGSAFEVDKVGFGRGCHQIRIWKAVTMSTPTLSEGGTSLPLRPALKGNEPDEPTSPRSGPVKGKTPALGVGVIESRRPHATPLLLCFPLHTTTANPS
jgi:hypothetical protein